MKPADVDFELFRASTLLDSDPAAAARAAAELLKKVPGHAATSLLLATAVRTLGDTTAALAVLEGLSREHPRSALIFLELGRAYDAARRPADASNALRRAVELEPDLADGWRELSRHLETDGDSLGADRAYARYEQLSPGLAGLLAEASDALRNGRPGGAESLLRRQLKSFPADVEALRLLADAAARGAHYAAAEQALNQSLMLAPGFSAARHDLAQLFLTQQKPDLVLPLTARLLRFDPQNHAYQRLEAAALSLLGRHDRSIEIWQGMLSDAASATPDWMNYGHELKASGRSREAIAAYRKCIVLDPASGTAYWSLANMKTFRFDDADMDAMRRALAREDLRPDVRVGFEFALGKALEDCRQFEEAFTHYAAGNARWCTGAADRTARHAAFIARSRGLYTREFFAQRSGWGSDSVEPIFIVGLPRAGSTLLEQILASHSQVEGTRELADITAITRKLGGAKGEIDESAYLDAVAALGAAQVRALAAGYLETTRAYRLQGRARFIDKMPNNWLHVGLIHLMFPRASIIDARRHPLGCCFSCYKQHFAMGQLFTYDLVELGDYYRRYAELMEHFGTVLPGRVHRVYYEQVVASLETHVRALLDYCALPFEDSCLRFHETRRSVQTASSEQVRQPIYTEAADQWRHFEPWLGPLKDALSDTLERYPA